MLRDYQKDMVDAIRDCLANDPNSCPLGVLPTGGGKSFVLADISKRVSEKGKQCLILAHRKELIAQNAEKVELLGGEVGICCASLDKKEFHQKIICGSIQTVFNNLDKLNPDIIIIDEAHRVNNKNQGMYRQLLSKYKDARTIGLTATPFRLSGSNNNSIVGKGKFFTEVAYDADIETLIDEGFLSPLQTKFDPTKQVDTLVIGKANGDYKIDEAFIQMLKIHTSIVEKILQASEERKAMIAFCCNIEHSETLAEDLCLNGLKAVSVTGNNTREERDNAIQEMRDGKLDVLCGCDIFIEGFDVPHIDCVVLCRPTKSVGRYVQMVGRGLRKDDAKENCLVLDFGNNIDTHGALNYLRLIKDEKGNYEYEKKDHKYCPTCDEVVPLTCKLCPICSYEWLPVKQSDPIANLQFVSSRGDLILKGDVQKGEILYFTVKKQKSKKNGTDMLVIQYRIDFKEANFKDTLAEFYLFEYEGFPKKSSYRKFDKNFGIEDFYSTHEAYELFKEKHEKFNYNKVIVDFKKNNKFPKIYLTYSADYGNPNYFFASDDDDNLMKYITFGD